VMTRYPNIVTLVPDDTVMEAIQKMSQHQVDCLPVIMLPDETGQNPVVAGWVSKSNIIALIADIATAPELGDQ
jgi:DeoR family transcriptional regulator, catabolite repression regulator